VPMPEQRRASPLSVQQGPTAVCSRAGSGHVRRART
jgi:hypothetical protein